MVCCPMTESDGVFATCQVRIDTAKKLEGWGVKLLRGLAKMMMMKMALMMMMMMKMAMIMMMMMRNVTARR